MFQFQLLPLDVAPGYHHQMSLAGSGYAETDGGGGGYPMSHGENKTSMLVNTGMGAFSGLAAGSCDTEECA